MVAVKLFNSPAIGHNQMSGSRLHLTNGGHWFSEGLTVDVSVEIWFVTLVLKTNMHFWQPHSQSFPGYKENDYSVLSYDGQNFE